MKLINHIFSHPLTRGKNIDDPQTSILRRKIIKSKPFLKKIYLEWYSEIKKRIPIDSSIIELGSGAGFFQEIIPHLITTELFEAPGIDKVIDAHKLPFKENELDSIVMTDVLHHIPDVCKFFYEANRCIKVGGSIVMIEPWNNPWSKWVYQNLHHEPFDTNAGWKLESSGPLSGANGALPWILFERDKKKFERKFNNWSIEEIKTFMPFVYLLSGGVSLRSFAPGLSYQFIRWLEKGAEHMNFGMFALIKLVKLN